MGKRIKILAIFSLIENAREFLWYARDLNKEKFELICLFLNPAKTEINKEIDGLGVETHLVNYSGKSQLFSAVFKIRKLIKQLNPDIVHAQLFDASVAGLIAAKYAGCKNRIYTRHHGDLHHKYHPHAVKYDKLVNRLAKKIIAPSNTVAGILKDHENVRSDKISVITHGFDFEELFKCRNDISAGTMKEKYMINGSPVIGTVSRFTEWKGLHFTIRAFRTVLEKFPEAILILIDTGGDYRDEIEKELSSIAKANYVIIPFEPNMPALFMTFDVFVHVPTGPHAESFGQVYIESLALGVPAVFTISGILNEIKDISSYSSVVPYSDSNSISEKIIEIINNKDFFREKAGRGSDFIKKEFGFSEKIRKTEELYLQLFNG